MFVALNPFMWLLTMNLRSPFHVDVHVRNARPHIFQPFSFLIRGHVMTYLHTYIYAYITQVHGK